MPTKTQIIEAGQSWPERTSGTSSRRAQDQDAGADHFSSRCRQRLVCPEATGFRELLRGLGHRATARYGHQRLNQCPRHAVAGESRSLRLPIVPLSSGSAASFIIECTEIFRTH